MFASFGICEVVASAYAVPPLYHCGALFALFFKKQSGFVQFPKLG